MKKWIEGKWEYYRDDIKQLYMRREVGPWEMLNYEKISPRELKCLICGHKWVSRRAKDPLRCIRCQSAAWNTPLPPHAVPHHAADGVKYQSILVCADCQAAWKIREDHKIRPCPRCKSERVERDRIPADKINP